MSEELSKARAAVDRRVAECKGDVNLALVTLVNEGIDCCERGLIDDAKERIGYVKAAIHCAEINLWRRQ